jgi:hypothetical protein
VAQVAPVGYITGVRREDAQRAILLPDPSRKGGTMKEGTLVYHPEWGTGLVLEKLWTDDALPPGVLVLWNKPKTMKSGTKLATSKIYEEKLTILSETAG